MKLEIGREYRIGNTVGVLREVKVFERKMYEGNRECYSQYEYGCRLVNEDGFEKWVAEYELEDEA